MHVAWLSSISTGIPLEVIRVEAVIHCAVTQGRGVPGGMTKGHPAIIKGAGCNTVGCPLTRRRGFGEVGWASPPCAHNTVAPACNKKPGIDPFTICI
jgi:hypothetical protein